MKYVERVLQPGETVAYQTSLHWLVYSRAIALLFLAVVCWVASGGMDRPSIEIGLEIVAGVLALLAGLAALDALIRRATTELAVTDRRVIYKTGIFQRHTLEMNRSKIETVGVDQSIIGRLLDFGTITVRGTGGSFEPIRFIGEPLTFRNHITAG
jgi:uncharacterized membrane protein YdbT with pleckstrin-like domain